jgi:SAM-dependent methyltransferase
MSIFADNNLYSDPALAQFYDAANTWGADFDFCVALAANAASVLDLGCGTGELAAALGRAHDVTGVDPAAAMLEIARARPGGAEVAWIEADARSVRLERRFDLILLTGHAFQVILTDEDQSAVLKTIAAHLAPKGRFMFDTRNPMVRSWEGRDQSQKRRRLDHPTLGAIEAWNESSYDEDSQILTYENGYRILKTGKEHSATAQIRYTLRHELAGRIAAAGLSVERWLGDWTGHLFDEAAKEIIPVGGLA